MSERAPNIPVQPISPEEVTQLQKEQFPPEVIETFNVLIAENMVNGEATVKQKDAVARMVLDGLEKAMIYKKGWLNIEEMYREVGWSVVYDKPAYNETYDAFFRFSAPKK